MMAVVRHMNINASIIDQRVRNLAEKLALEFEQRLRIKNDPDKLRSASFVYLTAATVLDCGETETLDMMTEGGSDFGVDALDVSDVLDGEFTVTLFQGKYSRDLEGNRNFQENGVTKAIQAVRVLFDPAAEITINERLRAPLEEIRSLISDGNLPRVRFILCNNGLPWTSQAQELLDREQFPESVGFEHVNHDTLLHLLQAAQPVKDSLRFHGKAVVEDFNYIRVFVGKVAVREIADLLDRHGDRLLERNIRRYLGLSGNRVNEGIRRTLSDPAQRPNFYFYNNGLTFACRKFDYNALQAENHQVRFDDLQIINGGQTCITIQRTLKSLADTGASLDQAFVLVRVYQLPEDGPDLIQTITYATNSQNPVDLRDLRSNDERQRLLETSLAELGYHYRRQRSLEPARPLEITTSTAAEAVLSVWRRHPQQARFMNREHFGKLYDLIFSPDLNGSQLVVAVMLYRIADGLRRNPPEGSPSFLHYAPPFMAMLMGDCLLREMGIRLAGLNHRNFGQAKSMVEKNGSAYAREAMARLDAALKLLYNKEPSLQRLAATFRRGDLHEYLAVTDLP